MDKPNGIRYACLIEYDGTPYVGFQIQENGRSVQAEIEKSLARMAKLPKGERIQVHGSGRTDSGVHALGQVIHFDYPAYLEPDVFVRAMNTLMDRSIRMLEARVVTEDFHVRYLAKEREYLYRIDTSRYPDPFKRLYTLHHPYSLNIDHMQSALNDLIGTHDFTSFCSSKTDKENLERTLYVARVERDFENQEVLIRLRGNGFLYNMVRIIVGTLLQIGNGRKPVDEFRRLLQIKDRDEGGPTAPPHGLYLLKVYYDQELFLESEADE